MDRRGRAEWIEHRPRSGTVRARASEAQLNDECGPCFQHTRSRELPGGSEARSGQDCRWTDRFPARFPRFRVFWAKTNRYNTCDLVTDGLAAPGRRTP